MENGKCVIIGVVVVKLVNGEEPSISNNFSLAALHGGYVITEGYCVY